MSSTEPRIGVFICHCGGNIGNTIDVESVKTAISQLPHVDVLRRIDICVVAQGRTSFETRLRSTSWTEL